MAEQMMGWLIAMAEQITAKVEDNTNAWWEGNKACQEAMEACLEKAKARWDATDASLQKVKAEKDADQKEMKPWWVETKAYLEKQEANQEEIKSVAVHEEVPKEQVAVKTVRAPKKRHGDRHIAVRRRDQPKKRTQGNGGSQKKLVSACTGMTRCAIPAQRKDHCC
jgi:hypothetical protein